MKKIGYYGCPPREVIREACERFGATLLDLDVDFEAPESGLLPSTTCRIIRNIVNNALAFRERLDLIVATTGEDKCDSGRFIARILAEMGFPVQTVENRNRVRGPIRLAKARMPLREKMTRIMDTVHTPFVGSVEPCVPTVGFWGVLPHDLGLLDLFPDTTEVFGWTRCVEAGTPSDLEVELELEPNLKTVFFTQSFCAKQSLAKVLAERHGGLFIDADGPISHSVIAKVEAFLRFA